MAEATETLKLVGTDQSLDRVMDEVASEQQVADEQAQQDQRGLADRAAFDKIVGEGSEDDEPADLEDQLADELAAEDKTEGQDAPENVETAIEHAMAAGIPESQIESWLKSDPNSFIQHVEAITNPEPAAVAAGDTAKPVEDDKADMEVTAEPAEMPESFKTAIDRIVDAAGEDYVFADADAGKEFMGVLATELYSQIQTQFIERDKAYQTTLAQRELSNQINQKIESTRTSSLGDHPQLSESKIWEGVLEHYDEIADAMSVVKSRGQKMRYDTPEKATQEAIKRYLSDDNPAIRAKGIRDRIFSNAQAQRRGQPRANASSPITDQRLTAKQRDRAMFDRVIRKHRGALAS